MFTVDVATLLGAAHGLEIPFVFGHWDLGSQTKLLVLERRRAGTASQLSNADDGAIGRRFARSGDPNGAAPGAAPRWEPFAIAGRPFPRLRHRGGRRRPHGARRRHGGASPRRGRAGSGVRHAARQSATSIATSCSGRREPSAPTTRSWSAAPARVPAPVQGDDAIAGDVSRQSTLQQPRDDVDVLELHAVRIREEDRVVSLAVRIVGGRVEDRHAERHQLGMQRIDGGPRRRAERQVMQSRAHGGCGRAPCSSGFAGWIAMMAGTAPRDGAELLRQPLETHERQHLGVELLRAPEVGDREVDVMQPRRSPRSVSSRARLRVGLRGDDAAEPPQLASWCRRASSSSCFA